MNAAISVIDFGTFHVGALLERNEYVKLVLINGSTVSRMLGTTAGAGSLGNTFVPGNHTETWVASKGEVSLTVNPWQVGSMTVFFT